MTVYDKVRAARHRVLVHAARTWLARNDVALVDTETTGLVGASLLELAVVSPSGELLFESLVNPEQPIEPEASTVHGLHADDLVDAPGWPVVLEQLVSVLRRRGITQLAGYCAWFDEEVVVYCCRRHGLDLPDVHWLDVAPWLTGFLGYAPDEHVSLDEVCRALRVPPGNHRARGDCEATIRALRALAATGQPSRGAA